MSRPISTRSYYGDPNPQTPAFSSTHDWIKYYLAIHQLSPPSYRYAYLLWFFITFLVLLFGVLGHAAGGDSKHRAWNARWHKWSIRRPSLFALFRRKNPNLRRANTNLPPPPRKTRTPAWWKIKFSPSPVYGELLALTLLAAATVLASVLGPDYLKPTTATFDLVHNNKRWWSSALSEASNDIASRGYTIVVSPPGYTIRKAWWTVGGRTGLIAFALFPLCIAAALKAPPFAVFALRFPAHVYSDKLAWLHRWTGRFIFLLTVAHVATWSVQLSRDRRVGINGGGIVWLYAFAYDKFIFGVIAFVCMALLVVLSYPAFRRSDFELFYALHVILVPLTLAFSSLHFPPLGPWCWAALALWGLERAWRLVKNMRINGSFFQERVPSSLQPQPFATSSQYRASHNGLTSPPNGLHRKASTTSTLKSPSTSKGYYDAYDTSERSTLAGDASTSRFTFPPTPSHDPNDLFSIIPPGCGRAEILPGRTIRLTVRPQRRLNPAAGQYAFLTFPILSRFTSHPFTIVSTRDANPSASTNDLESGLRKRPTRRTADSTTSSDSPQLLEFIIRARQGLTLDLWNHLQQTRTHDPHTGQYIPSILRVRVDGSYGSAVRMKWTTYGSVLIVVGGSGVAFGLSVLSRVCQAVRDADGRFRNDNMRSAGDDGGRDSKSQSVFNLGLLGGRGKEKHEQVVTTRIRFVWLVREYSHLMWCATNLRRLVQMVPPNVLQIDIFVTNFTPTMPQTLRSKPNALQRIPTDGSLVPPSPIFAEASRPRPKSRTNSMDSSEDSDSAWSSDDSIVDLSYAGKQRPHRGRRGLGEEARLRSVDDGASYHGLYSEVDDEEEDLGDGRNMVMALTNFDGEEDEREPAESSFSARVKKQGQHVRRKTLVDIESHQRPQYLPNFPSHSSRPPPSSHRPLHDRPAAGPSRRLSHPTIEENDADIGDVSVTADVVFEPTSPSGRYSYIAPQDTPGASSSRPPSRPTSPPSLPRGAAEPRIQALRQDTHVTIHSPLSPQYHSDHPSSTLRLVTTSPAPQRRAPSRAEHNRHARRSSARMSVAESLYSQYDRSPTAESMFDLHHSDTQSLRELLSASEAHLPTTNRDRGDGALDYLFHLSPREREDMGYVAALARPGRPRLDKILSSEVERSTGAIAVACCGPSSLDIVVRKLVSSQVDPSRVRKGDQRGYITFYNEEFSF